MKLFDAEVKEKVVFVNGLPVVDCQILGEGGDSKGVVVMAESELAYIPNTSPDLSTTLKILSTMLSTLASGIYAKNGGGDIVSPTFATDLADLKMQVEELKGVLK